MAINIHADLCMLNQQSNSFICKRARAYKFMMKKRLNSTTELPCYALGYLY